MSLIESIHNLVAMHFCQGHVASLQLAAPGRWSSEQQTGGRQNRQGAISRTVHARPLSYTGVIEGDRNDYHILEQWRNT